MHVDYEKEDKVIFSRLDDLLLTLACAQLMKPGFSVSRLNG